MMQKYAKVQGRFLQSFLLTLFATISVLRALPAQALPAQKLEAAPPNISANTQAAKELCATLSNSIRPHLSSEDLAQALGARAAISVVDDAGSEIARLNNELLSLQKLKAALKQKMRGSPQAQSKVRARLDKITLEIGSMFAKQKELRKEAQSVTRAKGVPQGEDLRKGRFTVSSTSEQMRQLARVRGTYTAPDGDRFPATFLKDADSKTWIALVRTKDGSSKDPIVQLDAQESKALGLKLNNGGGKFQIAAWRDVADLPSAIKQQGPAWSSRPLSDGAVVSLLNLDQEIAAALGSNTLPGSIVVAVAMTEGGAQGSGEPDPLPATAPGAPIPAPPTDTTPCATDGDVCRYRSTETGNLVSVPCCATNSSDNSAGDSLECLSSSSSNPDNMRCYKKIPTRTPAPNSTTPPATRTPVAGPTVTVSPIATVVNPVAPTAVPRCDATQPRCISGGTGMPCSNDSQCQKRCDRNRCIPGGPGGACSLDSECAVPTINYFPTGFPTGVPTDAPARTPIPGPTFTGATTAIPTASPTPCASRGRHCTVGAVRQESICCNPDPASGESLACREIFSGSDSFGYSCWPNGCAAYGEACSASVNCCTRGPLGELSCQNGICLYSCSGPSGGCSAGGSSCCAADFNGNPLECRNSGCEVSCPTDATYSNTAQNCICNDPTKTFRPEFRECNNCPAGQRYDASHGCFTPCRNSVGEAGKLCGGGSGLCCPLATSTCPEDPTFETIGCIPNETA